MTAESGSHGVIGFGYEGTDQAAFVTSLARSGVGLLVDVRLNAISRKQGFSKRGLAQALADSGIGYEHAPELGNPSWNRAGFSGSDAEVTSARITYRQLIRSGKASARIDEIAKAAATGLVAVLCVESDERHCHRYVVLSEVRGRLPHFVRAVS
ncbi:MAG TPA: DUF488 domain-containing protein [Streptosporangiaceae bacterium]|nr:DUF488 domain-containing protein [Streptosporangiaceae bacterium]